MGASFLNLVATKVTVKGEEQKFVSLHLRQGFNRHHTFTVVVNYLSPNNTFQQTPEKFIGYIGETASISFVHRQTGESYDFEGIITQVEMAGELSASRKTPYIQKKISGQCRRKAIWILKLFMRKPAVRQIKKEKYYKNIKKLLLFHHVSNIILIV